MAGGGTGGHVIPAVAVARELKNRGHQPVFVGTRTGFEAKLVPAAGFPLEFIEIGGLKRVGAAQTLRTLAQLPASFANSLGLLTRYGPSAIFSMGGYAAGPVTFAAWWENVPIVIMEPNAVPGLANRLVARFSARALVSFPETRRFFPAGRSEITGLPVRCEFFDLGPKPPSDRLTILVTGGSRGSRTLNNATRESWSYLRDAPFYVRLLHQTGTEAYEAISKEFAIAGIEGEVVPFISDMPAAFAKADLVVCRSGAGAVAELAAAGKPSILVPFPFAADDHQLRNAEAFANARAACLVLDREMNGARFYEEVNRLAANPPELEHMGTQARTFAHPNAAQRAADVLEEVSAGKGRARNV
jgi:UDP-N-acetylglucosamine--N-acetylmuramyl-(pentapeptide) pyrophosphoryl-undecaprenol N-acetylglucosamine transferase